MYHCNLTEYYLHKIGFNIKTEKSGLAPKFLDLLF